MSAWDIGGLFVLVTLAFLVGRRLGYRKGWRWGYREGWQKRERYGSGGRGMWDVRLPKGFPRRFPKFDAPKRRDK